MPIVTNCPNCKALFQLPDEFAGETVRCEGCKNTFEVPPAGSGPPADELVPMVMADEELVPMIVVDEPRSPVTPAASKKPTAKAARSKTAAPASGFGFVGCVFFLLYFGGGTLGCIAVGVGIGFWVHSNQKKTTQPPEPQPVVVADNKAVNQKNNDKNHPHKKDDDKKIDDKKINPGVKTQEPIQVVFGPDGTFRSADKIDALTSPHDPKNRLFRHYVIPVEAGVVFEVDLQPGFADGALCLFDDEEKQVGSNGEAGGIANPFLVHTALRTGSYHLRVTSKSGKAVGDFEVVLRRRSTNNKGTDLTKPFALTLQHDLSYRQFICKAGEEPVGDLVWARDGKSFYVLRANGLIQRINVGTGAVEKEHAISRRCTSLTMSGKGLLVSVPNDRQVWLVDPNDLSVVIRKIPVDSVGTVTAGADADYAIVSSEGVHPARTTTMIDLTRGVVVHTLPKYHIVTAVTSDGKYVFAVDRAQLVRYRRAGMALIEDEVSYPISANVSGLKGIALSPDDRFVCASGVGLTGTGFPPPPDHPKAGQAAFYVYPITNLKRPAFTLDVVTPTHPIGLDPKLGFALVVNTDARAFSMYSFGGNRQTFHDLPVAKGSVLAGITVSPFGREVLMRTWDRFFYVKMHTTPEPFAKVDPIIEPKIDPMVKDPVVKKDDRSVVVRTARDGNFLVKDLSLTNKVGAKFNTMTPCWDAQGKYLYWLEDGTKLYKLDREFKIEVSTVLATPCNLLVMSAEGLVTYHSAGQEIFVIDAETLAVRKRFNSAFIKSLGATSNSSTALILTSEIHVIDLKTGKTELANIKNAPANFNGQPKNFVLSRDGKYLCVMAMDYSVHRLRVDGNQLHHEETRMGGLKSISQFYISPDNKYVLLTSSASKKGAAKASSTEIFAMDNWRDPAYTLPIRILYASFDTEGGLYGSSGALGLAPEVRYYPNPSKANAQSFSWTAPSSPRRLVCSPNGSGCLVLTVQGAHWIEWSPKN